MPSARPLLIIILTLLSSTISSWPEILAAPTPKFIGARAAPLSVHNHVRRGDEPFDTMILEARMDEPIQLPPPTRSGTINIEGAEVSCVRPIIALFKLMTCFSPRLLGLMSTPMIVEWSDSTKSRANSISYKLSWNVSLRNPTKTKSQRRTGWFVRRTRT
ncbi:hypothetical protein FB446DRAFT_741822 [Lentinula raphanica]|nr:hypothetical protein FB446DRAFT_741822 [Lentinula raphanica]